MRWPMPLPLGRLRAVYAPLVFAAVTLAALLGCFTPLDNGLRDLRFTASTRAPTGSVVFVDIDTASLKSVGVWPWPRHLHAELLDRLMQLGAGQVVFDVDFSTASNATDDADFARALADAGGYAYLAAFRQQQGTGPVAAYNLPIPQFLATAAPVAVNVSLDAGGIVRTYPLAMSLGGRTVPSAAAILAGKTATADEEIGIDFAINPGLIDRISAADLLAGRVDATRISGRQIVIGASAVELRDFFVVPRYGIVPGALLQIEAAETLKQGRTLAALGPMLPLAVLAVLAALGWSLRRRAGVMGVVTGALAATLCAELTAAVLQANWAILFDTAALDVGLAVLSLGVLVAEMQRRGEQKREAEARLVYLATHDPLTGILSRQSLVEKIADAANASQPFAVVALDLRRFRAINNTLGHANGDQLLRQVAARLHNTGPGAVARLSGDGFALLLPAMDRGRLLGLCQTIVDHLSFPYELDGHQATIAASAGIAMSEVSGTDAETILSHADMALTAAKQRAGSGVAIFAPDMHAGLVERQELDAMLRHAVLHDEIIFYYQPQVDLVTEQIIGVEALARWNHPQLGMISPLRFIAAAEETGLIVEIGRRALEIACAQAARWPEHIRVAINVSPVQFELSDLVADVTAALDLSGLDPRRLDLEITEGVFVSRPDAVRAKLEAIRRMGVGIALDDFGTGYSSLAYLGRLPIDKLKIDQSFVRRLPADPEAGAIVAMVMSLAHLLGKTVVAEGIETPEQAALLRAAGCPIGQGYRYGRPVPAADLAFLAETPLAIAG